MQSKVTKTKQNSKNGGSVIETAYLPWQTLVELSC